MIHRILLLIISTILLITSCHFGKNLTIDLNKISTLDFYKADIDGKKLFVKFDEVGESFKGKYFIFENNAFVDLVNFVATVNKDLIMFEYESKNVNSKLFGTVSISGDTIALMWFIKKRDQKHYRIIPLIREHQKEINIDNNRYKNEIFSSINVSTKTYGLAEGYYASKHFEVVSESNYSKILFDVGKNLIKTILLNDVNLEMDIYEPKNDTATSRPLIVLIHGGSFMIGDKKVETMVELANYYSKMGYVVASINYRLGFVIMPGSYEYLERSIYRANQDARAAIRYLVANEKTYRIDSDNIVVLGTSAGGFTALNVALMEEKERFQSTKGNILKLQKNLGCLDCSTNNFKNQFSLKGVVNMWGALTDISQFDEYEKTPILCIHGDNDKIVPINYDFPFNNFNKELAAFFSTKVWGSSEICKRAQAFGIKNKLVVLNNAGHEPQIDEKNNFTPHFEIIKKETNSFIYECISDYKYDIKGPTNIDKNDKISTYAIDKTDGYKYIWSTIGGKIVDSFNNDSQVKVVWFNGKYDKKINLKVINKSHTYCTKSLIVY